MDYCLEGDLVKYSNIYGRIDLGTSKIFDDSQDLGGTEDTFLNYIIKQIKIYTKKINNNKIIYAIQLTYKNIKTKELKELPLRGRNEVYKEEDIEIFEIKSGEYLTNFYIRYPLKLDYIYQLGFETNKKRKVLIGTEIDEEKNIITNGGKNIILGTFGYYNNKLDSFGILFIDIKDYLKKFYIGYFELKFKLKNNEKFRNTIENNYKNLKEEDKYLFKACLLPEVAFNFIIKFLMF